MFVCVGCVRGRGLCVCVGWWVGGEGEEGRGGGGGGGGAIAVLRNAYMDCLLLLINPTPSF